MLHRSLLSQDCKTFHLQPQNEIHQNQTSRMLLLSGRVNIGRWVVGKPGMRGLWAASRKKNKDCSVQRTTSSPCYESEKKNREDGGPCLSRQGRAERHQCLLGAHLIILVPIQPWNSRLAVKWNQCASPLERPVFFSRATAVETGILSTNGQTLWPLWPEQR